jgi:hypothetical protein
MSRAWVLWVGLAAGLTGCVGSKADKVQGRSQIGEDPAGDPDAFATLGWKTTVGNTEAIPVSGVGLVYGLKGTGSSPPPGGWRTMLEQSLRKQGYTNTKELLDDPNKTTSLVIVSALIPAGARKGDPIDVQIIVPEESRTTSLKGGQLFHCDLVTSDTTGNLRSLAKDGTSSGPAGGLVLGSIMATAQGPVVAGTFTPVGSAARRDTGADPENAPPTLKVGRVWGGGRVAQTRPYYFLMNPGEQNVRMAATVADRLVSTFHATADPGSKVAEAKTRELVLVNVPPAYRHNHYRFLLVARQVPLLPVTADSIYRRKLEEELLDPATALPAAIKLEALGGDCHRSLRLGLRSPSPWVRFAAADALAYLGQTDGAEELARLAEEHPAVRAQCLKALASLDDGASTDRLVELMGNPEPTLRYGAFVALRMADERNPVVGGQLVNNSYWLHRIAPGSPGLVHLTADRRSEVVLFGDGLRVRGPFTLPVGSEFAVSMPAAEPEVRVSRVVRVKGEAEVKELRCKPELADVLVALARLGGGHGEAVEFLMRADRAQVLSAALVANALPQEMTVQQLASFAAKDDPNLARADVEVAKVGVVRPNPDQVDYNLPGAQDAETKAAEQPAPRPPLSQNPGRLFGPKRPPEPATEPLAPAPAATPPAADAPPKPPLSQNPGTLFGRKPSKGN